MKIYALPAFSTVERQSGTDYVRMTLPMQELAKYDGFEVTIFKPTEKSVWEDVVKENDLIYFNYLTNEWGFAMMGCTARKYKKKLVMDIDDNMWEILPDNQVYETWKKGSQALRNLTSMCNEVDYITTTNEYLKHVIMNKTNKRSDQIFVLPNYIDLETYTYRKKFKNNGFITLIHFGSSTHFASLQEREFIMGVDKIMKAYPNVVFKTVHSFFKEFAERWGSRYIRGMGDPDIMKWIKERMSLELEDSDIMVVPLTDNVYNRCKSSTKFNEVSSTKLPGCWQEIRQYKEVVRHGYNGMLCKTAKDWHRSIKTLIDNSELRKKMGEFAYQTVEEKYQMKDNIGKYIDMFSKIV